MRGAENNARTLVPNGDPAGPGLYTNQGYTYDIDNRLIPPLYVLLIHKTAIPFFFSHFNINYHCN
jgi:hypothetical protein